MKWKKGKLLSLYIEAFLARSIPYHLRCLLVVLLLVLLRLMIPATSLSSQTDSERAQTPVIHSGIVERDNKEMRARASYYTLFSSAKDFLSSRALSFVLYGGECCLK